MSRIPRRSAAAALLAALVAIPAAAPALAQGEAGDITHRQSILTDLSPTGDAGASRVFTQLGVTGDGDVEVVLPDQSTRGLRNLGGLGRPDTRDDAVVWNVSATREGTTRRTVADNTAPLPVSIEISYELDGEPVEPDDVVGRSGELTVTYDVRNMTAEPTELSVSDGANNRTEETVDVAVPMVGTLSMTLDDRFVDVSAPGAAIAGDGRGSTVLNWSLLLFAPLGDEQQTVSWTAQVDDAIVPEANANVLPVTSESFASLASTQEAYAGAVASTMALANGAGLIDTNMRRLASGASDLLDGLVQLRDGASELAAGLNENAIPGARQLADGAGEARAGSDELAAGLSGSAAPGARQLADGAGAARAGAAELAGGLSGEAAPGAAELAAGLRNEAAPGAASIREGTSGLLSSVGNRQQTADDVTLLGGLNTLRGGIAGDILNGIGLVRLQQTNQDGCAFTSPEAVAACGMREIGLQLAGSLSGLGDSLSDALQDQLAAGLQDGLAGALEPALEENLEAALAGNLGTALEDSVAPALTAALQGGLADGLEDALVTQFAPPLIANLEEGLADGLEGALEEQLGEAFDEQVVPGLVAAMEGQLATGLQTALSAELADALVDPLTGLLLAHFGGEELDEPTARAMATGFAQEFAPGFAQEFAPGFARGFAGEISGVLSTQLAGFAAVFAERFAPGFAAGFTTEFAEGALAGLSEFADGFAAGFIGEVGGALEAFGEGFAEQFAPTFAEQLAGGFSGEFADGFIERLAPGLVEFGEGFDEAAFGPLAQLAGAVVAKAEGSASGLADIEAGLRGEVLPGFDGLIGGLSNPLCDRANPTNPANPCGVREVLQLLDAGAGSLVVGLGDAAGGAGELAAGLRVAAAGSQELAAGIRQIEDGAGELAGGLDDAAAGSRALSDGLAQIDAGANELADGLGDAGDGSEQIAEGLGDAADGGEQIADGTEQLVEVGTGPLAEGVIEATADSSRLLEHAKAVDERGRSDGLPYGTVEGADASAVYQFEIAGVGDREGPSGPVRGAAALLAFGALGALGMGLRRGIA